jgi:hypothetical protein
MVDMGAHEYQPVIIHRLYVNSSAAPSGDGETWTTAYRFLQDALSRAGSDPAVTEVWVAGGLYEPDRAAANPAGSADRAATFHLLGGVALYGGFPGQLGQEDDFSVRDLAVWPSILSGDLGRNDGPNYANNGENSYSVVRADSVGPETVLDGFTVRGAIRARAPECTVLMQTLRWPTVHSPVTKPAVAAGCSISSAIRLLSAACL